jgi:DNA modification methylase
VPTSELRVETVALATLFPSPSNPRHNDDAVEHVAASIRRFGFQQPLVAKRSGEVIAGNTRWKAAKALGLAEVPVVWFDGSELDATAFAIADNRTHEFAEWDEPALARLLQQLREEDALDGVGYDDAEIDRLIAELDTAVDDVGDDEAVEPPETPTTRRGDLWILGGHRLLCGDSTSADDVARLMAGEKASLLATDPPYLVDYQGGNHPQSSVNRPDVKDKHWDDYVDPQTSVEFFASFLRIALQHCVERVPVYQWHATRRQALVEEAWKANGLLVHQTIIWAKARGVLTYSHYLWSHEPAFYGWREGSQPEKDRWPDPSQRTVWEIDQADEEKGLHPTMKPLEIFERPIVSHTRRGEVVLEPFSGSGTQIIAAERHGRRCFAMELSPAFVDAAVLRWQRTTGQQATLDGDGRSFAEIAAERLEPADDAEES